MKTINLIALRYLDKELTSGSFCVGSGENEDDFVRYKLCENKDEDDGAVYVDTAQELPRRFKMRVDEVLGKILKGTPYEDRKFIYINTIFDILKK